MSVYIARAYADRIELLSDTLAWCAKTYTVLSIAPKIFQAGSLPLVLVGRGDIAALQHYAANLSKLAACKRVEMTMTTFKQFMGRERRAKRPLPAGSDILLAGWLGGKPFLDHLDQDDWQWQVIGDFVAGTTLGEDEMAAAGFAVEQTDAGMMPALKLLEATRRKPVPGTDAAACGGQVLHTVVTPDAVTHKAVGYWQDIIGTLPKRGEPLRRVGAPAGLMLGLAA